MTLEILKGSVQTYTERGHWKFLKEVYKLKQKDGIGNSKRKVYKFKQKDGIESS